MGAVLGSAGKWSWLGWAVFGMHRAPLVLFLPTGVTAVGFGLCSLFSVCVHHHGARVSEEG